MDLATRKKAMYAAFKDQIRALHFPNAGAKIANDRVSYLFEDGTSVLIHLALVRDEYGKDEFGVYTGLMISDGPIYRLLEAAGLEKSSAFPGHAIFNGTSHNLISKRSYYEFRSGSDAARVVSQIVKDVEDYYKPIIDRFTSNHPAGLNYILKAGTQYVRNPFSTTVVLLGLTNSLNRLDEVVAEARANKQFYDFHKSPNYSEQIVGPIRKWFAGNRKS